MSLGQTVLGGATRWLVRCSLVLPCIAAYAQSTAVEHLDPTFPSQCGTLENAYGPYDYTDPTIRAKYLPIVEQFHFNRNVEQLISGQSAAHPGGDLDYTLRAFPNHHLALYAMVKYTLKHPSEQIPPGAHYPGECYLLRAIRFKPEDASVRVIYGIYLSKVGRDDESVAQYEMAAKLAPNNAEVHYNLGLLYRKLHRLDKALEHAKIAYQLGYPLPGLKNQLERDGVWKSGPEVDSSAASPTQGAE